MPPHDIVTSPHHFWMSTCGIDNRRNNNPRHDTPWNGFTPDDILVCTLWKDEIITVFDHEEFRNRQFVKLGGRMMSWRGPTVKHGKEADENLRRAFKKTLRVIGYETEPKKDGDSRKIDYFYMDRVHELQQIGEWSGSGLLERLEIGKRFNVLESATNDLEIEPGFIFELVDSKGPVSDMVTNPAAPGAFADVNTDYNSDEFEPIGNMSNEECARASIPIMIDHVLQQKDGVLRQLTYEDMAVRLGRRNKHGLPAPRGLGAVLGRAMQMVDQATAGMFESLPYLSTVVVTKTGTNKGLPGVGVRERWFDYATMTRDEKRAKMLDEYHRILCFGMKWKLVLEALDMALPTESAELALATGAAGWRGGGESAQHKALKAFVKAHPESFGAGASWEAFEEYALLSADTIDVFFKSERMWVGVEVKSEVSDGCPDDYLRGLYQVVKYQAVLEAQARAAKLNPLPRIKVILVLSRELPAYWRSTAETLGIDVRENCGPTK